MIIPILKKEIDDFLFKALGLEPVEIGFIELWEHFTQRGDFEKIESFDGVPMYTWKNGEKIRSGNYPALLDIGSQLGFDIFISHDLPDVFKNKMGNKYKIVAIRHFEDTTANRIIVYCNRRKNNGEWSNNKFKVVEYRVD